MLTKPVGQLAAADSAGGEIQDEALLIIHGRIDLGAVQDQEGVHGSVPDALIAIDERVALNQREAQRCGLLNQRRIQTDASKTGLGLGDG